jgi:hypothetical protein
MPSVHAPCQSATTARLPLYLYGLSPTQVSTDGPALLVRITHKAPLRYPMGRLARVIAGPRVEWQASALSACQHEGLPIVFLDSAGEPTGYLQPVQAKPSRLDSVIEEMLDRADWPLHYGLWQRAERMARLQAWHSARLAAGKEIDTAEYRELVRQYVYQPDTAESVYTPASPQAAALTAYTLQTLHHAGLKTRYWGPRGDPLELAADLTRQLGLALTLELHGLGAAIHGDHASLLQVLHRLGPRIEPLLLHLLGNLHRRLKTLLEEWR